MELSSDKTTDKQYMVIELIRAVSHVTGNFDQPIRLEILATGAAIYVDSLTVIGFMRICGKLCFLL